MHFFSIVAPLRKTSYHRKVFEVQMPNLDGIGGLNKKLSQQLYHVTVN